MTTIALRADYPNGLTNAQIDANFSNLNNDKVENTYLANTFPGSANITTLGSVTSGTWNATTIAVNRGGTGTTTSTGSGSVVLSTSPTLVTPTLGVASATSINRLTITAPATSATLTIANGKTFTVNNTLTLNATDASTVSFGSGGTVAYTSNKLTSFAATTSAELATVISDETGSGKLVFATSPTFTTSIQTDSTTFFIANTIATTLNIGAAATVVSIGASTGTTTINNNATVTGNLTATDINSSSDISLKTNVEKINNAAKTVCSIEGVEFDWKKTGKKSSGVIAQQIEKVLPHLVNENDGVKNVNYSGIIAYLIEAIKDQQQEIDDLKNLISSVK